MEIAGEWNPEALQKHAAVYPDKQQSERLSALRVANGNTEEAVNLLLDVSEPDQIYTPSSPADAYSLISPYDEPVHVILKNFATSAINSEHDLWVDVKRDEIWCICLGFYKTAMKHPERLVKNLSVRFVGSGEMGSDAGALRNEFFSLCCDEAVFEGELGLIPRRGIGRKDVHFEVVGALIAHSVLQGGPGFPFLAEWVIDYLLGDNPSNLPISKEYICRSEVTATLLELLEELDKVQTPEELHYVLEIHAKHDSFWEVINASEW